MRIPWLYTNPDGRSCFGELDIPQSERPGVVGAASLDIPTEPLRLQTALPGTLDFHPAPRRQLVIVLSGGIEIELADGERRQFGPGQLFLADDTTGQGHITRTLGEARHTAQVGVPAWLDLTAWRVG